MKLYDLTLKKEVARECAWGVQKKIGLEIKNIPTMDLKEVEELNVKCKFLMGIFSEMEEI